MKGRNEIILNQATMIEALQYWMDSQFQPGKSPRVTRIETVPDEVLNFKILIAEPPVPHQDPQQQSLPLESSGHG